MTVVVTPLDHFQIIRSLSFAKAKDIVENLGRDPADQRNLGGYWDVECRAKGYCDTRLTHLWMPLLIAAYLDPDSDLYNSDAVLDGLRLWVGFMQRRQYADGSIGMWGGGIGSAPEAAFTVPGLCASYRRLAASSVSGRDELMTAIAAYIKGVKRIIHNSFPFTSNHRWTAFIGPLAIAHHLFPEPGDREIIENYLADGIDMDSDGLYVEERSPNYNMVANWGLLYLVDSWGRTDFLALIARNLDLVLEMRQPNGEAETLFSHRQDRGRAHASGADYWIFKRMAVEQGDGRYASMADTLMLEMSQSGRLSHSFIPLTWLMDEPRFRDEDLPRAKLPSRCERQFQTAPLYRWRHDDVAMTVAADPGEHFWDITQGSWGGHQRSDAFMSLHAGQAIIDVIRIRWACGTGGFRPEKIEYDSDGSIVLIYRDPGWDHVAHFRPKEQWGPRHYSVDLEARVRIRRISSEFHLDIHLSGWPDIPISIQFLLRENATLVQGLQSIPLEYGGQTMSTGESCRLIGPDGSAWMIEGLPASAHAIPLAEQRIIAGQAEVRCHRLLVSAFTPFSGHYVLRPQVVESSI